MTKRKKLLRYVSYLSISIAGGVTILSFESLLTRQDFFQYFALGLTVGGLLLISVIVANIVKNED